MIKPASALCNLRCKYCFYEDVSKRRSDDCFGVMEQDTANRILDNVFDSLDEKDAVSFVFQGGEPTLAGLSFFRDFVLAVQRRNRGVKVSYSLQTNGTLISDEWCVFLKKYDFLVGLSLDIIPKIHNEYRVDALGYGSFGAVSDARALFEKYGVEYNVVAVLTNELSKHSEEVWDYLEKEDIKFVQFIPCLGRMDGEKSPFQLEPVGFARFYTKLFMLWRACLMQGKYRSVKLFDDLMGLLMYGTESACGLTGKCSPQIVVESDGRVFPCDFYALDEYCVGNLVGERLETVYNNAVKATIFAKAQKLPDICGNCLYLKICHGGCRRMREEVCGAADADVCGYRMFLEETMPEIHQVVSLIKGDAFF